MSKEITTRRSELATPTPTGNLDAQGLIALALEKQVPVETIEQLANLAIKLKQEDAKTAYYHAVRRFQAECPIIPKARIIPGKGGLGVRCKYAGIEDVSRVIQPILDKCGLSYRFDTRLDNAAQEVCCIVTHELGHSEKSSFTAPIDPAPGMSKPQASSSAASFAKRCALCNSLGIVSGDEDTDGVYPGATQEEKPASPQDVKRVLWGLLKRQFGDDIESAEQELRSVRILHDNETLKSLSEDRIKNCISAIRRIERKRATEGDLF